MGYDIGLKPINNTIRIESRAKFEKEIQVSWAIDLVTVYMLDSLSPLSDANMMRIYASAYKRDVTGLNDEKLTALATAYQAGIECFFYLNLFNKLNDIILRWESIVKAVPDGETFFSIPTNSTTAFNNLLTYHKMDPSADDTLQFNAFKSTLVANAKEWFQAWYEDFDISKYIMPKDRFLLFIDIVKEKIAACYQRSNSSDSVAMDYHTKINVAIDYIKALLMIVHQTNIETRADAKKTMMDNPMVKYLIDIQVWKMGLGYASRYAGVLKLSHILCLDTTQEIEFPTTTPSEAESGSITSSDEFQLLFVTYLKDHFKPRE